ncbi:conjugal transfer protein TrbD [Escherichia coli]|nr:conjugal transfer protein TrbD [Escherichia coli]
MLLLPALCRIKAYQMILCMLFSVTAPQTKIVLPAPEKFSPESLPHNFNMAAVGVMKKGMSMSLFSSPGHIVVAGQSGGGKSVPVKKLIDRIIQKYKEPFDE